MEQIAARVDRKTRDQLSIHFATIDYKTDKEIFAEVNS